MTDTSIDKSLEKVYQVIVEHIRQARSNVLKAVNHEQVIAYWNIGKNIIEQEQHGENRAAYGKALLERLSTRLNEEFGKGFGVTNLKYMRQFYLTYQNEISHKPGDQFEVPQFNPNLSWSHYRLLMRETRRNARKFYEIEAANNYWSVPQLQRQMGTFLFDRLAASQDEQAVLALANKGQIITTAEDSLKNPVILEFLGYKEHHTYTESDLESAIIDHLQEFLLEMGKGFAFIGRQKRITIDGDHFYPDLIFYHTILKCYTIIDLKINHLTHGDVGQMQMYVNYYDREIKQNDDNPTIGLLLCAEKNDAVVKFTLPENNKQIFARKYQLHLPTVEQLKEEIRREYQEATLFLNKEKDVE
ncbi:PDDEXK nuclease domain-containing protein [Legionella anisa]|uniref:DUF1016 domain-containing protein n=1 Tax=Legionella anisa TaxID=28082 RepID=A0AAX0WZQ0_9GAMM|nr:PDDEXK nuclease domain-containing protein [Legionella anisa]KTC68677.1 hypothetical protein Lani_2964 [Legionella anisa]PNL73897.1 DUF1016 domain-containing protein [Legionella anisa]UAK81447.1 PDDEXK nuclease domain-containing protein [Legionella anisa]